MEYFGGSGSWIAAFAGFSVSAVEIVACSSSSMADDSL
jgi:hypothetical protein